MDDRISEIRYLRRRVVQSIAAAASAASPCAEIPHRTLARLYDDEIVMVLSDGRGPA